MFSRLIGLFKLFSYSVSFEPFKFVNKVSVKIFRYASVEYSPFSFIMLCVRAFSLF